MIDFTLAQNIISKALSTGGDFAEIFVENRINNLINAINGKPERAVGGIDYGLGLRIFNGYNAVYAYTNDLSEGNLMKIAANAADTIDKNTKIDINLDFTVQKAPSIHPFEFDEVNKKDVADVLRRVSDYSFGYSDLITQTTGTYFDEKQEVAIINSEGLWAEDTRKRTRLTLSAVASSADEKQTGFYGPGAHKGYELISSLDLKFLGEDCARIAATMLDADYAPGGRMPVIIDKGFGGVIFHEACGHSLEATSVAKGSSEFCDKLNQPIASPLVTALDDGTIPNFWGSLNIDDEGAKAQKNLLIENGILKSYLIDKLNGLKMGMASTGSGRRQSYRFAPTSRMTNTYIQAGQHSEQEIISSTEYGLYAVKMGGGSVMPATGEFNFAVLEGYLIRNGKIEKPVRGATLVGKGSEVLLNIDMVADKETQEQGMCGSISGSIPTNVGQPMIRVKELTVGGRTSD